MIDWKALHKRFFNLSEKSGISNVSSYYLDVWFGNDDRVYVSLGGYDIPSWNRHVNVGNFKTEKEAYEATIKKIEEAEKEVNEIDWINYG